MELSAAVTWNDHEFFQDKRRRLQIHSNISHIADAIEVLNGKAERLDRESDDEGPSTLRWS